MDCQLIKINLLPREPKRKIKTKSIGLIISAAIIALVMSGAGMFFVYSYIASACTSGYINIKKVTSPCGSTQQFSFTSTSTVASASNFFLSNGQTKQLTTSDGTYTITESKIDGWQLTSIVCSTSLSYSIDLPNRKVTIKAKSDSNATCTFTNTKVAYCGDGTVGSGETCDVGTANGQVCTPAYGSTCTYCSSTCQPKTITGPYCGDGIKNGTEACDDGNTNDLDSCRNNCALPVCGDGTINGSEVCDAGTANGQVCTPAYGSTCTYCSSTCQPQTVKGPYCGDGTKNGTEQCDAGSLNGTADNDCSSTCTLKLGSLTVCKYNDTDKNGLYGASVDTPLAWNMTVTYPGGTNATVRTDSATGCYKLSNVPYGTYQIAEENVLGWVQSSPKVNPTTAIVSSSNADPKIIFLNYKPGCNHNYGSIQVCKLIDADGQASTTADRSAATSSIWTFNLISASGTTTKSTTIGDNCVTFSSLSAGSYQVQEEGQSGWQLIEPTANDINVNLVANQNVNLTFANAKIITPKSTVSGYKYNDANNNGVIDSGEPGLSGWTIQLIQCPYTPLATSAIQYLPNGTWSTTVATGTAGACTIVASTVTDNSGHYQFTDLDAGDYGVAELQQSGWTQTYPAGNTFYYFHLNAGDNDANINFANYHPGSGPSYGSIQVCKLIDADGLASTTADQTAATSSVWTFNLVSASGTTTKSTTIGDNCVTFSNLLAGSYSVNETILSGWQLIDPVSNNANINLNSGDNKSVNFVNTAIVVPSTGTISGYKYNDANNNGTIDSGDTKLSSWPVNLIGCPYAPLATSTIEFLPNSNWTTTSTSSTPIAGKCSIIATTTTDSTGYYQFGNLTAGDYGVAEGSESGWNQTYPANNTFYYFHLNAGDNDANINFANYKPTYCGDGTCNGNETCSTCSADCGSCGGGGGGGSITYYNLYNTSVTEKDCNAVITWNTNLYATSQVYYDTVPHSTSTMPNKDYVYATIDDVSKVTGHNVTITGLKPNTTYYFRAYSEASSVQYSQEISYTTAGQCGTTTVKGLEGQPELAITKMVNTDFANPGQQGIEYLITVSNKGDLTAYGVNLKDLLPTGLKYADVSGDNRSWDLGDMAPGASKAVAYKVNVNADAQPKDYINTATATATNQDKSVQATAKLEVRSISVLAATGFRLTEFIVLISTLSTLVGLSIYLRRKSALNED